MFGDDFGPWYTPKEAAPMLGLSVEVVQDMCATNQIEHRELVSATGSGRRRYHISRDQIARFNRSHTRKAS